MNNIPSLQLKDIRHTFSQGNSALTILEQVNLAIYPGEIVALVGASGVGKSTLLHIAGLLESPTSGCIVMDGQEVCFDQDNERTQMRLHKLGFVYQYHHLQPEFTALENVCIPQLIRGTPMPDAIIRAEKLLVEMGLQKRLHHRPAQLSGGEQQRVAIARALANEPRILLADEPTGNLDPETSDYVFQCLVNTVKQHQTAALIATHNYELAKRMDRIFIVQNRCVIEKSPQAL